MLFSIVAFVAMSIGELPSVVHSDCEVSTNIALNLSQEVSEFSASLSLEATPSSAVEMAFGTDVDLNNKIGHSEIDLIIACECGEWRVVDTGTGFEFKEKPFYGNHNFIWRIWTDKNNRKVKVWSTLNGNPVFTGMPCSASLFKKSWTHLKITSRGEVNAFGELNIKQSDGWFFIKVK